MPIANWRENPLNRVVVKMIRRRHKNHHRCLQNGRQPTFALYAATSSADTTIWWGTLGLCMSTNHHRKGHQAHSTPVRYATKCSSDTILCWDTWNPSTANNVVHENHVVDGMNASSATTCLDGGHISRFISEPSIPRQFLNSCRCLVVIFVAGRSQPWICCASTRNIAPITGNPRLRIVVLSGREKSYFYKAYKKVNKKKLANKMW